MNRDQDIERRLAELEQRTAWTQPDIAAAPEVDVLEVLEILMECGGLPAVEDSADEAVHADVLIAELERWRRINGIPRH